MRIVRWNILVGTMERQGIQIVRKDAFWEIHTWKTQKETAR
jgi:hypothetical protein